MTDIREQILAQLLVVATGVDGVKAAVRNRTDVPDIRERPSIVIHDMDEKAEQASFDTPVPRRTAIKLMEMTPYIAIKVAAGSTNLGTLLNLFRARLVSAVLNDSGLKTLIGRSGAIEYAGCATHPLETDSREGVMEVDLTFTYVLLASDLAS